jgi:hypothetical protein
MPSSGTRAAPQSKRRKSKIKSRIKPDVPPVEPHRDKVLTLAQWAAVNGFSIATARRILDSGDGPPLLQLSPRRVGIKESANAEWQASRAR